MHSAGKIFVTKLNGTRGGGHSAGNLDRDAHLRIFSNQI